LDENYQTYLNRAMRMTLPDSYRSQVQHIQESPKYQLHPGKGLVPLPFPGYTIITPPGGEDGPENQELFSRLGQFQEQLVSQLGSDILAPLPLPSFHLTLADLIWDGSYRHAAAEPSFEEKLRQCIGQIFQECASIGEDKAIRFQALGFMVMPRAVGICLGPTDEYSYDRILKFRRALYQNQDLIGLGIEQQYYFTPHITLGYFGPVPTIDDRLAIAETFIQLNQRWLDLEPQLFSVHQADLRKFNDMTHYYRESDWPILKF
jgi:hypothetical protein